jgi:endoglucanase
MGAGMRPGQWRRMAKRRLEIPYIFSSALAESYVSRMSIKPSYARKSAYDTFFQESSSILAKMDGFWLLSAHDSQAAMLNLVAQNSLAKFGNAAFVVDKGFQGDGAGYFLSRVTPGATTNYQSGSCSIGGGVLVQGTGETTIIGGRTSASASWVRGPTNTRLNSSATKTTPGPSSAVGHTVLSRLSTASYERYQNGINYEGHATVSAGIPITEFAVMGNHEESTATFSLISTSLQSFAFIGGGLTADEITSLYYSVNRYLALVGAESLVARTVEMTVGNNGAISGGTVTYSLVSTGGARSGSIDVEQIGTLSDSSFTQTFASALSSAVASTSGVTFDGIKRLTFSTAFVGPITFNRTLAGTVPSGAATGVRVRNGIDVVIQKSASAIVCGTPTIPSMPAYLRGANISGAEFSGTAFYPTSSQIDFYKSRGFNVVRLPHKWDRLQPILYGNLDISGTGSGNAEKYKAAVDYITSQGMYCIIDPHDYAGRSGVNGKIGSANLPVDSFDDYWIKLVNYLGDNNKLIYNLVNEPSGIDGVAWFKSAMSITAAIRSTGKMNHIHVPGSSYTGAHSWVSSGNSTRFASYSDPANNFAFEVHQYLDGDSSGQASTCTIGAGSSRLDVFLAWCRETTPARKAFLGEFAANPSLDSQCGTELPAMMDEWETAKSDVTTGWTAWGGGSYWNSTYPFRIEQPVSTDPDNTYLSILKSYVPVT